MAGYDVYVHKKGREGVSALNPESPTSQNAVSPRSPVSKAALLGYGSLLANRTYSTIVGEIQASGNEVLANQLGNLGKAASIASAAIATKGLSLIPEVINATASTVARYRTAERESRVAQYNVSLKGARVNYNQGRVNFD